MLDSSARMASTRTKRPLFRTELLVVALILVIGLAAWISVLLLAVGTFVAVSLSAPAVAAGIAVVASAVIMAFAVRKACEGPRHPAL